MFDFTPKPTATDYVAQVGAVHDFLLAQTDLSPRNPEVNRVLSAFVHDTMRPRPQAEIDAVLQHPIVIERAPGLRRLLGRAEFEMENFCAKAMVGDLPSQDKRYSSYPNFIYRDNYAALVSHELAALGWPGRHRTMAPGQSIAFIGAGPLPITAIMLHQRTGLPVTCVDSDPEACRHGERLIRHLAANQPGFASLATGMTYVRADARQHDYAAHPIVFVASLVGEKEPALRRIAATALAATTTVVRSTEALGALLYEPHQLPAEKPCPTLQKFAALSGAVGTLRSIALDDDVVHLRGDKRYAFSELSVTHASPETINTSVVYSLPAGKLAPRRAPVAAEPLLPASRPANTSVASHL